MFHKGEIDESRLGWSLTKALSEFIEDQNSTVNDDQSTGKLQQIEIELDEIANNVKQNINSIFERGEKFGVLANKSQALKSSVSMIN